MIAREYEYDRMRAQRLSQERKADVYRKAPRLAELERLISAQGMALAKIVLGKLDVDAVHDIKARQQALVAERNAVLQEMGMSQAYLEDTFNCGTCKDTAFVGNVRCGCFRNKLAEKFYSLSNVSKSIEHENFGTFSFDYYSDENYDNMRMNYADATDFVARFPNVSANLLIYGKAGLGKTFLCNCIAKEILDAGHLVIYVTAPQLFKKIEDKRFGGNEADFADTQLELVYEADLLIIDDLGSEFGTVVTKAELFNILNSRLLERRPMVISTNLMYEDFRDTYSDRIYSRVFGGFKLLKFFGEDIREMKKRGRMG